MRHPLKRRSTVAEVTDARSIANANCALRRHLPFLQSTQDRWAQGRGNVIAKPVTKNPRLRLQEPHYSTDHPSNKRRRLSEDEPIPHVTSNLQPERGTRTVPRVSAPSGSSSYITTSSSQLPESIIPASTEPTAASAHMPISTRSSATNTPFKQGPTDTPIDAPDISDAHDHTMAPRGPTRLSGAHKDSAHVPVLPSPAPSDGSRASPSTLQSRPRQLDIAPSTPAATAHAVQRNISGVQHNIAPLLAGNAAFNPSIHTPATPFHTPHVPSPALAHATSYLPHGQSATQQHSPPGRALPHVLPRTASSPPVHPSHPQTGRAAVVQLNLTPLRQITNKLSTQHQLGSSESECLRRLSEAVAMGDIFFVVLNQMMSILQTDHTMVPKSFQAAARQYSSIIQHLVLTEGPIVPELTRFFSRYPTPTMDIYSDVDVTGRNLYEATMTKITIFLQRFQSGWKSLLDQLKEVQAPLLVQDMVELLGLDSIILQRTVFTTMVRGAWPAHAIPRLSVGFSAMDQLLRIDQSMYYHHGHRRTVPERQEAYSRYKMAITHLLDPRADALPGATMHYFQTRPRSQRHPIASTTAETNAAGGLHPQTVQGLVPQAPPYQPTSQIVSSMPLSSTSTPNPANMRNPAVHPIPWAGEGPAGQVVHPDPTRSALHQAAWRSPVFKPLNPATDMATLYRHVIGFALPPTPLHPHLAFQKIAFIVSADDIASIPTFGPQQPKGARLVENLDENSLIYRLRCAAIPPAGFTTESVWVVASSVWPEELTFKLNGIQLETRRKLHHGAYLPINLTHTVRAGMNELVVAVNRTRQQEQEPFNFALAVEVVGLISAEQIKAQIPEVSAADALEAICTSLQAPPTKSGQSTMKPPSGADDADDIVITSSNTLLSLCDPHTLLPITSAPVRGKSCLHKTGFDLDTFLAHRHSPNYDGPSPTDNWRCPICRGDARPAELIKDGFLAEVLQSLAPGGARACTTDDDDDDSASTPVKAITVDAKGDWTPVIDEENGVQADTPRRKRPKTDPAAPLVATSTGLPARSVPRPAHAPDKTPIIILD